jgi:hypothetical protein
MRARFTCRESGVTTSIPYQEWLAGSGRISCLGCGNWVDFTAATTCGFARLAEHFTDGSR